MIESLDKILNNAATGLSAQSIRMSTISSNLANSGSVGSSEESTYHKKYPVFSEIVNQVQGVAGADQPSGGVVVSAIKSSEQPLQKKYEPENPMANADGFVYLTDVNPIEEMTNMMAASREYEANIELMNTTKNLMAQSIGVLKE